MNRQMHKEFRQFRKSHTLRMAGLIRADNAYLDAGRTDRSLLLGWDLGNPPHTPVEQERAWIEVWLESTMKQLELIDIPTKHLEQIPLGNTNMVIWKRRPVRFDRAVPAEHIGHAAVADLRLAARPDLRAGVNHRHQSPARSERVPADAAHPAGDGLAGRPRGVHQGLPRPVRHRGDGLMAGWIVLAQ